MRKKYALFEEREGCEWHVIQRAYLTKAEAKAHNDLLAVAKVPRRWRLIDGTISVGGEGDAAGNIRQ